jgi:hypothetical protein
LSPRNAFFAAEARLTRAAARYGVTVITFRDGPLGRRAGVIGGPDVWEIVMWIEDAGDGDDLIADQIITRPQADAALAYRAAHPSEIQARINQHRDDTAAASAW